MLAAFLFGLAHVNLSGHDRIVVLKAYQRLASFFQAQVLEEMAVDLRSDERDGSRSGDRGRVGGGRDRGGVAFDPPGGRCPTWPWLWI